MQNVTTIKDAMTLTRARMDKTVEDFRRELSHIRTGRASVSLLEDVKVDYYGQATPLNAVAKLSTPDPTLIVVQPFDPSMMQTVEKAIRAGELGLNPVNDGKVIRVPIPPLTEERRKDLVKVAHKHAEEGRVAIRNIRREAKEMVEELEDDGEVSEDDSKRGLEELQKLTDKYIAEVDALLAAKDKEIMEV